MLYKTTQQTASHLPLQLSAEPDAILRDVTPSQPREPALPYLMTSKETETRNVPPQLFLMVRQVSQEPKESCVLTKGKQKTFPRSENSQEESSAVGSMHLGLKGFFV